MRCSYCGQFRSANKGPHVCPVGGEVIYAPPDPWWWAVKRFIRRILNLPFKLLFWEGME